MAVEGSEPAKSRSRPSDGVLVAIVGAVAAVLVALVGILPQLIGDDDEADLPDPTTEPTPAPTSAPAPSPTAAQTTAATTTSTPTDDGNSGGGDEVENGSIEIRILEDTFTTGFDKVRPANEGVRPDGVPDIGFAVELTGGPTGLVVSACNSGANLSLDQWDTFSGEQPRISPPLPGWGERDEPTYQLGVFRDGALLNPSAELTGQLEQDTYWLYISLFDTPTRTTGICVTAIRDSVADTGPVYSTTYAPYTYPPVPS